jgi:hypothetical protein
LHGPGYLGDAGLVVTAFDKVNLGKWHGMHSLFTCTFQCKTSIASAMP